MSGQKTGEQLEILRFIVKKHAQLFVQINHSEYLENFINAVLLPIDERTPIFANSYEWR